MDELKKALEELQKSWADYRKTNDERLAAMEKGQGVAELEAKLAKIDVDVAKNQKLVDELSALQAQVNRMNLGGAGGMGNHRDAEIRREFNDWAHQASDKGYFRAAATRDSNPDGGFLVMPEFEAGMDRVAETISPMRQLADVRATRSAEVKLHVTTSGAGGGWVGERDVRGETDTPELDEIVINVKDMYAKPKASQDLLDDAEADVAAWLQDEAGITFGELEGAAFISGNTPKRPRGILSYDKVANASYAWGKLGYVHTGVSGGFHATNPADNIIDLVHALKGKYRNGAAFIADDTVIAAIRKFKNTYGYLWQPSLVAGNPSTIIGYPVYSDGNVPVMGADSYSLIFGNFKRGYAIRDRAGISILRDPYSTKGFVEFYTTKRLGAGVRNFEAIKLMKFGTS
jgi:HK97 family phage major capsid protein